MDIEISGREIDNPTEVARIIRSYLTNWSDGRYDFSTELIHDGLKRTAICSVRKTLKDIGQVNSIMTHIYCHVHEEVNVEILPESE